MDKKKFYVNVGTQEVSQIEYGNNQDFTIYATEAEARLLRGKLNDMDQANFRSFFRAHVPIMSYHNDKPNDDYDDGMTGAYQMLYALGDEQTKQHIESMGILSDNHLQAVLFNYLQSKWFILAALKEYTMDSTINLGDKGS